MRDSGPTHLMVRDYLAAALAPTAPGDGAALGSGPVTVRGVRVLPAAEDQPRPLMRGEELRVEVDLELAAEVPGLDLAVFVTTGAGVRVLDEVLSDGAMTRLPRGASRISLRVPPVLNVGDFAVGVWLGTPYEEFLSEPAAASFTLHGSDLARPERVVVLNLPFAVEHRDPV